jgi:hypothetical protein
VDTAWLTPSHFSRVYAPVEADSRRRTGVKEAEIGWRRAAVAPGARA